MYQTDFESIFKFTPAMDFLVISSLKHLLTNFRFADLLDILVVTIFIYSLLSWLRQRASRSVVIGLGSVVLLYATARIFNMYMTSQVFQAGLTAALVALVIIFQDDIRMAFEKLVSIGTFRSKHQLLASNKTVDWLVEAACNMARDRIGALIVLKGREVLDRHLNGGISVNGRISVPLLYSIFHPETPSHDGAVIVEGDRIDKFAVRLPLSHNLTAVGEVGTRHTAALGLAERSDVLVVVVSEERGVVSVAEEGKLEQVTRENLRTRLNEFYRRIFPPPSEISRLSWISRNAGIKCVSLISALILWSLFAYRVETINRTFTLPIEYRNVPSNWVIDNPQPSEVRVSLYGAERSFNFDHSSLVISLDLGKLKEGTQVIPITERNLSIPAGLTISNISPRDFSFRAYQMTTVEVPVHIKTKGKLPKNLLLSDLKATPASVRITIPKARKSSIIEVTTEPLDLESLTQNSVVRLGIQPPASAQLADENQRYVRVSVTLEPKQKK